MFLKYLFLAASLCSSAAAGASEPSEAYEPSEEIMRAREEFRDAGFGIFLHWGIYSMLGQGEWALNAPEITHAEYKNLTAGFYPSKFDARKWVDAIADSGAKYICITSRHHDGFSMFDTALSDYNIVDATPFGRDVLKELADACRERSIKLHFYYSHLDWGRDDYNPVGRTGHEEGRNPQGKWEDYLAFMRGQLTELLTNYGPIGAIWFDGMWDRDEQEGGMTAKMWDLDGQYALIHKLQPSCLVGNNHHTTPFAGEDIQIFERDKPGENTAGLSGQDVSALPLETCQTMNESWGYKVRDTKYKSATEVIRYLVSTAGRNANLLLNIGPRPDGSLPDEALANLKALGEWMRTYGATVQGVRGGKVAPHSWGVTTQKGNKLFVHITGDCDENLFIPYSGNKLKGAKEFASSKKLSARQTPEGIIVTLPGDELKKVASGETADYVVELAFANPL